jgi:predicted house-cleaning noncanonical NTP pyrophosphatase (MazG superfamily)
MYKKLVRDNIPDIIKENNEEPIIKILSDEEYKKELEKKLIEECNEVLNSESNDRIEELADLLEVMISLAELENNTFDDIEKIRILKKDERGGFSKKIYLEEVK